LIKHVIWALAVDTDFWFDNHQILDSTPVECGRNSNEIPPARNLRRGNTSSAA
jgi:hypothetical protein